MIYTKTGDKGTTSLVGGSRVSKDSPRVEAYGTVDELNSHIGLLGEMIRSKHETYYKQLKRIQHNLFTIQTLLATEDEDIYQRLPHLSKAKIETVEKNIDAISKTLPKLQNFVISGGNIESAECHVARTVCRRAERCIVSLTQEAKIEDLILKYINRLSDYLFVLSRYLVVSANKAEDVYIN